MLVASDSSTMTVGNYGMARDGAGNFVMAWEQEATAFPNTPTIQVQRFDAAGKPRGSAFQVGATTIDPDAPSVAMDAAGDFVVAWVSVGAPYQNTATYDVHAQRYAAAGTAQGGEFLVSTLVDFDDVRPRVAMDAAGDFVIIWQGQPSQGDVPEPSGTPHQIYARRYSAAGTAQGDQFLITNAPDTDETLPSVAMAAAGGFVVAWQTGDQANGGYLAHDILAQRFDAAGVAQGGAFPLSSVANTGRQVPRVAMDAAGRFVVAWINYDAAVQAAGGDVKGDIHAQRYDAAGTPQGGELPVNTFTAGDQSEPSITMDAAGDFAVAWESYDQAAADSNYDVYTQRYSAVGTPVGTEFIVNTSTGGSQDGPAAAMDADGDMVVAWRSYLAAAPHSSIYVRRFAGEKRVRLRLGAAFAPAKPSPGSSFSMTLAADNISATEPTGMSSIDADLDLGLGITGSVTLPKGVSYQSAHGTGWTCAGPAGASLRCTYGAPLAAGSTAPPLTVMLKAPSTPGSVNFSAMMTSALKPAASTTINSSVEVQAASESNPGGASSSGDKPGASSSGGGALDFLSLGFLGLALLRRRRPRD